MVIAHGGMNPRAAEAAQPAKIKKEVDHIRVSEADNGGHLAETHFTNFEHAPEQHVFAEPEMKHPVHEGHILHHIAKAMHIPHTVVEAKEEGAEETGKTAHEPDEEEELEAE